MKTELREKCIQIPLHNKKNEDTYDDYVKPPSYSESHADMSDNDLMSKLRTRIQQDLNQINGVYNEQISAADKHKQKLIQNIEVDHNREISNINSKRKKDIAEYNDRAEKNIDNLILNMNSQPKITWKHIYKLLF